MEWSEFIVSILAGLAAAIPLVVKLVEYVQKAVKEKNWEKMLALVMDLMEVAETKFESGADKKEWCSLWSKGPQTASTMTWTLMRLANSLTACAT